MQKSAVMIKLIKNLSLYIHILGMNKSRLNYRLPCYFDTCDIAFNWLISLLPTTDHCGTHLMTTAKRTSF